jgi:hypothetical protein
MDAHDSIWLQSLFVEMLGSTDSTRVLVRWPKSTSGQKLPGRGVASAR